MSVLKTKGGSLILDGVLKWMACDGTCITQTYGGGCAELRCGVCIWITTPPGRLMDESRFLLEQLIPTSDRSEGSLGCIQK